MVFIEGVGIFFGIQNCFSRLFVGVPKTKIYQPQAVSFGKTPRYRHLVSGVHCLQRSVKALKVDSDRVRARLWRAHRHPTP